MITTSFKQRLKNGEVVVGAFYKTNNQNMVEMMAYADYDFIIVDNEHSNFDHVDIENIVRSADGVKMDTIIRLPSGSEENILHSLDSGASGIQVPSLRNVGDVQKIVPFTKYYPQGHRGMNANQRSAKYGFMNSTEYFKMANENTLIVVHVENLEMAEHVDELCQIPEVDVVFIGPGDLSQAIGKPLQVDAPEVIEVVDGIIKKTKKGGKVSGIWVSNQKDAQTYIDKGVQYLGFTSDTAILVNALKEIGKQVKALKQYCKQ
jgi:4-hydroxy-2-oxoheptanedioate aldolase